MIGTASTAMAKIWNDVAVIVNSSTADSTPGRAVGEGSPSIGSAEVVSATDPTLPAGHRRGRIGFRGAPPVIGRSDGVGPSTVTGPD